MHINQHFRRIPDHIWQELHRTKSQYVVIAAFIDATRNDLEEKYLRRFNAHLENNGTIEPNTITPPRSSGIYARRNLDGIIYRLINLPKITKTFSWESPNFGDPSKGYHTSYYEREVYQRRLDPPRDWEIHLSIISKHSDRIQVKAQIITQLDKKSGDFENDLFFGINLMQELFRNCHVFDGDLTDEEIAKVTVVGWDIFPPGIMGPVLASIQKRLRNPSQNRKEELSARLEVLNQLKPSEFIVGSGMNSHYFGAKFGENIVAFENIDYGNAIYILFDNWMEISQMSRVDILKRHERDYIRIVHKKGWEKVFRQRIENLKDNSSK